MKDHLPTLEDFNKRWLQCVSAMDLLVAQKGYDALTFENIAVETGIPAPVLASYFRNEAILRDMYDKVTVVHQYVKIHLGGEKIN